jgi:hypothetical protein
MVKVGGYGAGGSKTQLRFKRDDEGRLDPNGEEKPKSFFLKMKYTEEMRMSLGCAIWEGFRDGIEGEWGVQAVPFNYTMQWICTISDYKELQEAEITMMRCHR